MTLNEWLLRGQGLSLEVRTEMKLLTSRVAGKMLLQAGRSAEIENLKIFIDEKVSVLAAIKYVCDPTNRVCV